ncbi:MAG: hypothetical protein ABIK73_06605 [candidate division WOR-3 bacterium]
MRWSFRDLDRLVDELQRRYVSRHEWSSEEGRDIYEVPLHFRELGIYEKVRNEREFQELYDMVVQTELDDFMQRMRRKYEWILGWWVVGEGDGWLQVLASGVLDAAKRVKAFELEEDLDWVCEELERRIRELDDFKMRFREEFLDKINSEGFWREYVKVGV